MTDLPDFPYHPDPIATGFVEASDTECIACGKARGFIYIGPAFAGDELVEVICPWCIADGKAATKFDAEFTDVGWGVPDGVPAEVTETIAKRTPGFNGWQQEHWLYHCNDGAAFLGRAGSEELESHPDAIEMLRREGEESGWDADQIAGYIGALDKDGEATAYLFRCRHCGTHLAYSDSASLSRVRRNAKHRGQGFDETEAQRRDGPRRGARR
jgi:uncharacterized protein CbrC (UPF0167 family)